MNKQVTYLMSGNPHMPYLVCSLLTLRESGYGGKVEVYAWPEAYELAAEVCKDERLCVTCVGRSPKLTGKDGIRANGQFLDKIDLTMELQCDLSLYLDADTTIHGRLDPLFEEAEKYGFCMTQFCEWRSNGGIPKNRLLELKKVEGIPHELVDRLVYNDYPSVNGGVWCASPRSEVLPIWYEWTKLCKGLFISDERILHLMMAMPPYPPVLTERGIWNCSHRYKSPMVKPDDVVVWHYHGDSNVRQGKSPKAFEQWMGIYDRCVRENVGGIRNWAGLCGNEYLEDAEKAYYPSRVWKQA